MQCQDDKTLSFLITVDLPSMLFCFRNLANEIRCIYLSTNTSDSIKTLNRSAVKYLNGLSLVLLCRCMWLMFCHLRRRCVPHEYKFIDCIINKHTAFQRLHQTHALDRDTTES